MVYDTRSFQRVSEGSRDASVVSTPIHNIQPHSTLRRNSRAPLSLSSLGLPSPLCSLASPHYQSPSLSSLRRNSHTRLSSSSPGLPSPHYFLAFLIATHYCIQRCAAVHARFRLCLYPHRSSDCPLASPHFQPPLHITLRRNPRSLHQLDNRRRLSPRSALCRPSTSPHDCPLP
jgi:hypothetical protein